MREDVCYVLRLWRDGSASGAWRASLENLRTGERQRFADCDALMHTLEGLLGVLRQGPLQLRVEDDEAP